MKRILQLCLYCVILAIPTVLNAEELGQTWWGHWNTSMPLEQTAAVSAGTTVCGIRLTTANAQLVDGTVHGVRFWLADKSVVSRAYVWLSVKQFAGDAADVAVREISLDALKDQLHDGEPTVALLDAPVSILPSTNRYASVYVGYTLETTAASKLMAAGPQTRVGSNTCFVDWNNQEAVCGPLALQLLVSGSNIPTVGMALGPLAETIVMAGQTLTLPSLLTNGGSAPVESVDCQVTIDGVSQPVQHFSFSTPLTELGYSAGQDIQIALPAEAKAYDCQVSVTQVNGQPNQSAQASQTVRLIALSQRPVKRTVMEELTGTWCPNCPRGLVGLQLLEEQFADRFVGIAIHGGDSKEPMRVDAYDGSAFVRGVASRMGGRPSCSFDRMADGDPYWGIGNGPHFGADKVVGWLLNEPCVADVEVAAAWSDDQPTVVSCDVATTFRYSSETDDHYALVMVLTADSLTGSGTDWVQINGLSGKTDLDADLDLFTQGPRRMSVKFNHVAIAVAGVENGISGSVSAPFRDGEPQHFSFDFDTEGNALVQAADYLHAVAMLLDTRSGQVVNVAKCDVETQVQNIDVERSTFNVQRSTSTYDLGGRRVAPGGALPKKGPYLSGNGKKVLY